MSTLTALYAITATRVEHGKNADLLAYRTARSDEIDDVCQDLRRELRPVHGDALHLAVERR